MNEASDAEQNAAAYRILLEALARRRAQARGGGGARVLAKHRERGKLFVRERIDALLDPGSPFLELAQLAGDGQHEGVPPGAGMVTGIGQVSGRQCMIIANDATVKGGTYFGITCKKHVRAQEIAWMHRLPCITLVDSGGAFLPDQAKIFPDAGQFGSIFYQQVRMSAEGIGQIAVVMGACTAGGAYIPALADELVIVRGQGFMYLGGPQLTQAATGEQVDPETLGGALMHSRTSGVSDHLAADDVDALAITRRLVSHLGDWPARRWQIAPPRSPRLDPNEIYGLISRDARHPSENREILLRLVDDSDFDEFKPLYGDTLMCGFARINGFRVGVLANRGVLFTESGNKAAHFIDLCCKRDIPLLFLADVTGFMVGREVEQQGIAKAGARFITAMASANVPKYTVITGGSYGAGYLAMCGRAFRPHAIFMWPNARAAIMGPEQAATTLALVREQILARGGEQWSDAEREAFKQPIRDEYERFADAFNFASNLWVDGVIDPLETRQTLTLLLDAAARTPREETRFGVFRM
ncbi:MAG: methylcrotonoyl-CoA carboxylase [Burkholderiaceae bacterium]|nr:methylcrotonoyl-CoA carboxylase [Burkholderiaceae bacterium]